LCISLVEEANCCFEYNFCLWGDGHLQKREREKSLNVLDRREEFVFKLLLLLINSVDFVGTRKLKK